MIPQIAFASSDAIPLEAPSISPIIQNCNDCAFPNLHQPTSSPGMIANHKLAPRISIYQETISEQKKLIEKLELKIDLLERKIKELESE